MFQRRCLDLHQGIPFQTKISVAREDQEPRSGLSGADRGELGEDLGDGDLTAIRRVTFV